MAKPELGTKRIDPETGRKFYDLNKDPIVSPYTGKSYPRSFFEADAVAPKKKVVEQAEEEEAETVEVEATPNTVSLSDVEEEESDDNAADLPDVDDDSDDEDTSDDDDTFLPDEEEDDDDVADIIGGGRDDDDD